LEKEKGCSRYVIIRTTCILSASFHLPVRGLEDGEEGGSFSLVSVRVSDSDTILILQFSNVNRWFSNNRHKG
jgi:hypothetical protein